MKTTLSTSQAAQILIEDTCANWSRAGAFALIEYLEELEADTGEEIEFDPVALRCKFAEYAGLSEWLDHCGGQSLTDELMTGINVMDDDSQEQLEDCIRSYIQDRGALIEFDGGIIVSAF